MARTLSIEVPDELLGRWQRWLAPSIQPFPASAAPANLATAVAPDPVSAETRDTFFLYGGAWVWCAEDAFRALDRREQRALYAARRRWAPAKPSPPWPSRVSEADAIAWVEHGVRASQHEEVTEDTWRRAAALLPQARALAGTFPDASGANCFGTVLAAAGVPDAVDRWVEQPEFGDWLERATVPLRGPARDNDPGTVLVWHEEGQLAHAAVTLGDSWVLAKPSQAWSSPRVVWPTTYAIHSWTYPGTRLSRRILQAA